MVAMNRSTRFGGFKPSGIAKIAHTMGFQGPIENFEKFLEDNPDRQSEMMRYTQLARKMASGGYVRGMQEGGDVMLDGKKVGDVVGNRGIMKPSIA